MGGTADKCRIGVVRGSGGGPGATAVKPVAWIRKEDVVDERFGSRSTAHGFTWSWSA
jgi:hypothetical protein